METNQLITLYGENVFNEASEIIKELSKNSNFDFDKEYMDTSISFMYIHADRILNGEENKCNLKNLITKSFGESAIFKFNR